MNGHDPGNRFLGVGASLPAFSFPDLDGSLKPLSAGGGENFIVFMWASW
ncbi:MAG TPA: hypothetical protein VHL52_08780 [Acidimicrobiia bacterium]|nr:hypothetical protein [Acidimicrobiia bacterium]